MIRNIIHNMNVIMYLPSVSALAGEKWRTLINGLKDGDGT